MSIQEIDAALQEIAQRRASGAEPEAINEMVTTLACRSGHSYFFLKSNVKQRAAEIRARRWRAEAAE